MYKKLTKQVVSVLLVFAIMLSSLPLNGQVAHANEEETSPTTVSTSASYEEEGPTEAEATEVPTEAEVEESVPRVLGETVASRRARISRSSLNFEGADSDGVYSDRNWVPDSEERGLFARLRSMVPHGEGFHFFGASRSMGDTHGDMSIERVAVMYGGEYQSRFRDQVGQGHTVSQGESGNWYTTSQNAMLMDGRTFTIQTLVDASLFEEIDYQDFLDGLAYTYGDLPFDAWLGGAHFNDEELSFIHWVGDDLISYSEETYILESIIEFRSPYPAANPANVNIPFEGYRGTNQNGFSFAMRHVIGTFDLAIYSDSERLGSLPINLNLYDDFNLWPEVDQWARDLQGEAGSNQTINGRHVDVTSLGQSPGGQEIWNVVVAASEEAVNDYFQHTRPRMTNNLADLEALRNEIQAGVHHRLPIYFHNIHPDEVTGVDAQLVMVEQLLREDYLTFETVNENQTHGLTEGALWGTTSPHPNGYVSVGRGDLGSPNDTTTVTISVEEALNHFIFIFVPTNNPDGHNDMMRSNSYGFDLNRDAAYQTQIENVLVVQDVLRWNPLAMLEFHGHVAHMLIEPTTGPHNPNYEYDLLQPAMLRAAHIMGRASISGAYDRYLIPFEHMTNGWDDGGPMYMPIFMMHFGILGFTLEIPHTNQDSLDANIAMGWAFVDHAMDYFDELFLNKLEHNRRGMTNADYAHLVDQFFTDPFTAPPTPIGRPRTEGQSFFPDYWVIPMDDFNQRNVLEAYRMLEKLERHGVQIQRTTERIAHDGMIFPVGTYIIDMRQARRGYVNTMLEAGYNASFFTSMYAEITMNFPDLRGFEAMAIWEEDLFAGQAVAVNGLSVPATTLAPGNSTYLTIRNNSQDSVRLINALLAADVNVQMLTSYTPEGLIGDFVVPRSALTPAMLDGLFVETAALEVMPSTAEQVVQPRIALLTAARPMNQGIHSPTPYILRDLGFEYTWITSDDVLAGLTPGVDFNLIVNHNQNFESMWQISNDHQIPIISVQGAGATFTVDHLFYDRGAVTNSVPNSREGTFLATYSPSSTITNHYERADAAYLIGATTFSNIPTGTIPLITVAAGDFEDVFLGGWWQGEENQAVVPGNVTAFTGLTNGSVPATVFGTNIFNRAHAQGYHNLFATAAFMHVSEVEDVARPFVIATIINEGDTYLEVALDYVASEVEGSTATITEQWFMVSNVPTAPTFDPDTAEAEGWQIYVDPISINPSEEFIHWFAVNSYGVSAQGNLAFAVTESATPTPPTGPTVPTIPEIPTIPTIPGGPTVPTTPEVPNRPGLPQTGATVLGLGLLGGALVTAGIIANKKKNQE